MKACKRALVINISGGVGNQLFQFALARSLSMQYGYDIMLNKILYSKAMRKMRINKIQIIEAPRVRYEKTNSIIGFLAMIIAFLYAKILKTKIFSYHNKCIAIESNIGRSFIPVDIHNSNRVYINGYFQSEKYFHGASDIIIKEILFYLRSMSDSEYISSIKIKDNFICLHVRGGDFKNNDEYDICSERYYRKSIDFISRIVRDPVFYVFSDDVAYAKSLLSFNNNLIYIENGSEIDQLYYMTMFSKFIISNSSFSWWAQYLSDSKKRIVVAPAHWNSRENNRDIYQDDWILINEY